MAHRKNTPVKISWAAVERTIVYYDGDEYRLARDPAPLAAVNTGDLRWEVGRYAAEDGPALTVKLTPGAQNYHEARERDGKPLSECDLTAVVLVAAIAGHADARADRDGVKLDAVWSHHLAVVTGEDPKTVAKTYAPTEAKTVAWRIQHMAARGIRVSGCEPET